MVLLKRLSNTAPWVIAVRASNINRFFASSLLLGDDFIEVQAMVNIIHSLGYASRRNT